MEQAVTLTSADRNFMLNIENQRYLRRRVVDTFMTGLVTSLTILSVGALVIIVPYKEGDDKAGAESKGLRHLSLRLILKLGRAIVRDPSQPSHQASARRATPFGMTKRRTERNLCSKR